MLEAKDVIESIRLQALAARKIADTIAVEMGEEDCCADAVAASLEIQYQSLMETIAEEVQ